MRSLCFLNGRFRIPGASSAPTALVARQGRIVALGGPEIVPPDAERIDLGGRTAIPGPVDAHCHLVSYGMLQLREADLRGAASLEEIGERLRRHAERLGLRPGDGRWLLGRGFSQDRLPSGAWPSRHDLDRLAPDRPLRITRICGHAVVANTTALRAAGLDPAEREGSLPEGVRTEERMAPLLAAIPQPGAAEWREAARLACQEAARAGFVGVHSLMAHAAEIRALVDLHREGALPIRVVMQLPFGLLDTYADAGLTTGFGDDWLSIGAVKLFSDGSFGARTAALSAPYADDPSTSGELIDPPERLAEKVRRIRAAGFQVCIHAIGDRALEATLSAIEAASAEGRWVAPPRVEHASLVSPALLRRMRQLGVGAAIQPQFARSDSWVPRRLGADRARWCYAFRTMWEAGIPLAGSTDCPVERLDALAAIGHAVSRPEWSPDEALPLDAALRIFSEGAHALRGAPPGTGRLAPGQPADFVVLEEDPATVPPSEVERIPVVCTVVGGAIRAGSAPEGARR